MQRSRRSSQPVLPALPGIPMLRPMYMLALGDSISAGVGASLPSSLGYAALLYRNSVNTWPAHAQRDVATLRPALQFRNLAQSGFTSQQILQRLRTAVGTLFRQPLDTSGPGIVVLTAGGNDLKNVLWQEGLAALDNLYALVTGKCLEATLQNLTRIVALLNHPRIFRHGVAIYLADLYDPTDGSERAVLPWGAVTLPGLRAAFDVWHERYAAFCRSMDVHLVNTLHAFRGHGMTAPPSERWLRDWLHPNDRGHHELRDLFYQAMVPTLDPLPRQ